MKTYNNKQTRDVGPILVGCWADAVDGGPKINQFKYWVSVCDTVHWRWLYFHVVWCLMITVVKYKDELAVFIGAC